MGLPGMIVPCAPSGSHDTRPLPPTTWWPHPLVIILLLAAALRLPLAFWPNFHHPDEVFQYVEPAWRVLGHDSIVSWEWRYGMRGWLLPTIMAGPVAIGDWIAPGGMSAYVLRASSPPSPRCRSSSLPGLSARACPGPMQSSPVSSRRSGLNWSILLHTR